jgi:hypothetical protein
MLVALPLLPLGKGKAAGVIKRQPHVGCGRTTGGRMLEELCDKATAIEEKIQQIRGYL